MARARYIICAKDRLVDQSSGLVSHINIIDRLMISQFRPSVPEGTKVAVLKQPISQIVLTAVWIKEQDDSADDEFEYETVIHKPTAEQFTSHRGEFRFLKKYYRIDSGITFMTDTNFSSSGEMILVNKIRKKGATDWISQEFSLDIEVNAPVEVPVENTTEFAQ